MKRYARFDSLADGVVSARSRTVIMRGIGEPSNPFSEYSKLDQPKSGGSWYAEFVAWHDDDYAPSPLFDRAIIGISPTNEVGNQRLGDGAGRYAIGIQITGSGSGNVLRGGSPLGSIGSVSWGDVIGLRLTLESTGFYGGTLEVSVNGAVRFSTDTITSNRQWVLAATFAVIAESAEKAYLMANTGYQEMEFNGQGGWYSVLPRIEQINASTQYKYTPVPGTTKSQEFYETILDTTRLSIARSIQFWPWGRNSASSSAASVDLVNNDMNAPLVASDVRDLPVDIYHDPTGMMSEQLAAMTVERVEVRDDLQLTVTMRDNMALLDRPLQRMLFVPGTLPADEPWPISLGAARSVTPVQISERNYVVHDAPVAGWGYVSDKGDPWEPALADYSLRSDGRGFIVSPAVQPQGKITADVSSVGGGPPPSAGDDILDGRGAFTGTVGQTPSGWIRNQGNAILQSGNRVLFQQSTGATSGAARFHTLTPAAGQISPGGHYRVVVEVTESVGGRAVQILGASGLGVLATIPASVGIHSADFVSNNSSAFSPVLAGFVDNETGTKILIKNLFIFHITDAVQPSEIDPITLTGFVREIMDRAGVSQWSEADTQAIDAASGYAGIGWHTSKTVSVRKALEDVLPSYGVASWVDKFGVIRFTRMQKPQTPVISFDDQDYITDMRVEQDQAPELTISAGYRKNWTVLNETDIVSDYVDVPVAVRAMLTSEYAGIVQSSAQLSPTYDTARLSEPAGFLLDSRNDAQAEIDRISSIYESPRYFYRVDISRRDEIDLGVIVSLTYDKYGLSGKPVMVVEIIDRPIEGTQSIVMWG